LHRLAQPAPIASLPSPDSQLSILADDHYAIRKASLLVSEGAIVGCETPTKPWRLMLLLYLPVLSDMCAEPGPAPCCEIEECAAWRNEKAIARPPQDWGVMVQTKYMTQGGLNCVAILAADASTLFLDSCGLAIESLIIAYTPSQRSW
jgi:hypothetical protein